ncbi:DUF4129 domain-containing protein [Georgenia thermotolerans]|uniref:DUF4129 domain-containing protein n=1 Tax=Georgenia thermotolerans TaxID=527326 RepID=A0A7J5UIU7_9MICO|nr:DUF4129 domain-containing protein [Georgenia thermotolerans]KAE8762190.1 DUF4129 domain-containing protein [Georgenia thermotolerans]
MLVALSTRLVSVAPDAAEARRWAEHELSKAVYDTSPSLVERLLGWLRELFDALSRIGGQAPPLVVPVVLTLVLAALLALGLLLGGRIRRRRVAEAAAGPALFDDDRSSADLARAADAAARRGDFTTAVLERFRAVIRSLDERGLLDDRPGLTAHEATALATAALPALGGELDGAGRLFDDVRYGHAAAGAEEDAAMRRLAEQVATARRPAPVAAS